MFEGTYVNSLLRGYEIRKGSIKLNELQFSKIFLVRFKLGKFLMLRVSKLKLTSESSKVAFQSPPHNNGAAQFG